MKLYDIFKSILIISKIINKKLDEGPPKRNMLNACVLRYN